MKTEQSPSLDRPTGDTEEPRRDDIFRATLSVALERGFGKVTLDAVAVRAGLSKGGLLYHFATKADLIKGLLMRYRKCDGHRRSEPAGRHPDACHIDPLAVAALIAAAEDPALLDPIAELLVSRTSRRKAVFASHDSQILARSLANRFRLKHTR